MSISLGPFLTCFVTILILTVYVYVMMKRSNDFFRGTVKIIFAIIAVIMLRMMVPVNFPFTRTIYSSKLLIGLGNIVYANVYGDREILVSDLLLWLWIGVAVILLIRYFYKRVKVRRILEQYVIKDTDTKEYYESFLNDTKIRSIKIAVIPGEEQAAIFGVIRPIMILPDAVLEEKTVAHMIRHEIKHYDSEEFEGSFEITPENAYYLKTENGYELYADDVYRWTEKEIAEEFREMGIPVYVRE